MPVGKNKNWAVAESAGTGVAVDAPLPVSVCGTASLESRLASDSDVEDGRSLCPSSFTLGACPREFSQLETPRGTWRVGPRSWRLSSSPASGFLRRHGCIGTSKGQGRRGGCRAFWRTVVPRTGAFGGQGQGQAWR